MIRKHLKNTLIGVWCALLLAVTVGPVWAQAPAVTFTGDDLEAPGGTPTRPPGDVQPMKLGIEFELLPAVAGDATKVAALVAHLERLSNYTFAAGWSGAAVSPSKTTDHAQTGLPFQPDHGPKIVWRNMQKTRGVINIDGRSTYNHVGTVTVAPLSGWTFTGNVRRVSSGQDWKLPPFKTKLSLGFGDGNLTLDASGEGLLNRPKGEDKTGRDARITTLSLDAKLPLFTPSDVSDRKGAKRQASEEVPDAITLALNSVGYRRGGHLDRYGLKARSSANLEDLEVVGYFQPFSGWGKDMRAFYGVELEAGYRDGNAEWTNLVTRAPDRGNLVARLGVVAEWAPQVGGINKHLGKGLRFFVRGRGWLDTFDDATGSKAVRFRPFLDAELFYNFTPDARIFARSEWGYLPPDLNQRVSRPIFAGVGAAF